MAYWLFKTEPDTFSIDTLRTQKVSPWEGVRNYQARNWLRDAVKEGDKVLIYHSSCQNIVWRALRKWYGKLMLIILHLMPTARISTLNRAQSHRVG